MSRDDNKENESSPRKGMETKESTMNLNQLFHSRDYDHRTSYESGYMSLTEQTSPTKQATVMSSTPVKPTWSSPDFPTPLRSHLSQNTLSPLLTQKDESWSLTMPQFLNTSLPNYIESEKEESSIYDMDMASLYTCSNKPQAGNSLRALDNWRRSPTTAPKKPPIYENKELPLIKEPPLCEDPTSTTSCSHPADTATSPSSEDKVSDILDLINQFIAEGDVNMLNSSVSTTPLRQYVNEEEGSTPLDLDSPKTLSKTLSRRSLDIQ